MARFSLWNGNDYRAAVVGEHEVRPYALHSSSSLVGANLVFALNANNVYRVAISEEKRS